MNKLVLKVVGIIALLVQVLIPVWWGSVWASFYYFWVEGIIEGGILGKEIVVGVDEVGNSIIGQSSSSETVLWGLFSIFCIVAAIVAFKVSFLIKNVDLESAYTKKDIVFLIINILTIILAVFFVSWNGGFIPRL